MLSFLNGQVNLTQFYVPYNVNAEHNPSGNHLILHIKNIITIVNANNFNFNEWALFKLFKCIVSKYTLFQKIIQVDRLTMAMRYLCEHSVFYRFDRWTLSRGYFLPWMGTDRLLMRKRKTLS